jgi:hypothetical protein
MPQFPSVRQSQPDKRRFQTTYSVEYLQQNIIREQTNKCYYESMNTQPATLSRMLAFGGKGATPISLHGTACKPFHDIQIFVSKSNLIINALLMHFWEILIVIVNLILIGK